MSLLETSESARARGGPSGRELLLRTTFACNQRCAFCSVAGLGRAVAKGEIEEALDALAREPGPRRELTLSGGEPAADPRLLEIIDAARARGFRRFVLQSNMVFLARRALLPELLRRGVKTFMVSFHSHHPAFYDRITGSRGQMRLAVEGLTRLLAEGKCGVTVNVVVNRFNYRGLPGLMGFLGRLARARPRGRRLKIFFSMINEAGHEKASSFAVDLGRAAPFLREALRVCLREGLTVEKFAGESALPVCLTDEPRRHAAAARAPQGRVRYAERIASGEAAIGRVKRPACRGCAYDARCMGVSARYAALFGLSALEAS